MRAIKTVSGTIATAGDHTIVAASANGQIKVKAYLLITSSTTAVTASFKNGSATNDVLWTVPLQALTGSISGVAQQLPGEDPLFETSKNTLLNLHLSAAQSVTYNVTYWDDEL